ncbi:MAG: metal-dependent transcriptional regulator [Promethearchaeota archaeon]
MDYKVLKTLYRTSNQMKVGDIAKNLNIPHSTAGSCVKRLEENGLVVYKRYKPVVLSEIGKELAVELIRHSQLIEILLFKELGLTPKQAHNESEKLNLLFSCEIINKICEKYNHPEICPCGDEILSSKSCFCQKNR